MIYLVACRFTDESDPARESQWNDYYDGPKLDALLSLDGFTGSQRFRCAHAHPAPYLALHTITGPEVMDQHYRDAGGGGFGGWEPWISNWTRDLFTGLDESPEVAPGSYLAITADESTAQALTGIDFAWLVNGGLDGSVDRLALAVLDEADGSDLLAFRPTALNLYRPITDRRTRPGASATS